MNGFLLLALILATWRITFFVVYESGPFGFMAVVRDKVGIRMNSNGSTYGTNVVANAMRCTYCFSFWVGLALSLLFFLPDWKLIVAGPMALSGGSVLCMEVYNRVKR